MDGLPDLLRNLDALGKKMRDRVLRNIGNKVGTIQSKAMRRRANARRITGALAKSMTKVVSVKNAVLVVQAGPQKGKVTKRKGQTTRQRKQFAVFRRGQQVMTKKGKPLIRQPTRYAHLAGKGRKGDVVQGGERQTRAEVVRTIEAGLREAIERGA